MRRDIPTARISRTGLVPFLLALGIAACGEVEAPAARAAGSAAPFPDGRAAPGPGYDAAAFLTARQAAISGDVETAAGSYTDALAADSGSVRLLEQTFRALYLAGRIDAADAIANTLERMGAPAELASEPAAAIAARNGDWAGLEAVARNLSENADGYVLGKVLEAWSLALRNRGDAGISALMQAARDGKPPGMLYTQAALMQEHLGSGEKAISAARTALGRDARNPDTIVQMAGVLARNGAIDAAQVLLLAQSGGVHSWRLLAESLEREHSFLMRRPDPRRLVANAVLDAALAGGDSFSSTLTRFRLAQYIDGDYDRTRHHLGRLLHRGDMAEEALEIHAAIAADSPWYQPSQIVAAMHHSLAPGYGVDSRGAEGAAAIYEALIDADPENPMLWLFSGDNARRHERYRDAFAAYGRAMELGGDRARLEYYRGIALDNLGRDEEAEAAFRRSLEYDGSNAYVLNYLGYWLLENGGDAREALAMIRRAVEAQPGNGFFMDSLGWGYYRLGQYRQALTLLERAVAIEPTDPTIIDHLGDAYEKNGRHREAVYEWRRAIHYADDQVDPAAIQAKIDAALSRMAQ